MRQVQGRVILVVVVAMVIFPGLLSGCGGGRGRKVLSFLFDGVPEDKDTLADSTTLATTMKREGDIPSEGSRSRDSVKAANIFYLHEPYAEGECTLCHNMPGKESKERQGSSLPSIGAGVGENWLVLPLEELCVECHTDLSPDYAEENDLNIHGPVATGECTLCHSPHRSRNEKLLLSSPVRTLCFQCHEETIAQGLGDHPELEDEDKCTECHNPHLSSEEFFLE